MAIYQINEHSILPLAETDFASNEVREREDLQRLLKNNIEIISPGTLIIAEEFSQWDDSRRRIDLLGIDAEDARLVVIELKRTQDGGHMELQALRYAAMVSTMTYKQVIDTFSDFLDRSDRGDQDAEEILLKHLGIDEPDEDSFAQDVRILLASADFSRELTTSVMWLNQRQLDITCVRLKPYKHNNSLLLDVQQVVPLPEAEDYQVRIAEKQRSERAAKAVPPSDARRVAGFVESFVRDELKARTVEVRGKLVFFLPGSWEDHIPVVGDAWKKRINRPTPFIFWANVTNRRKGLKVTAELGRFPNFQLRQRIVRELREMGFSIDKRGDRADARYTRLHSVWNPANATSFNELTDDQCEELVSSAWRAFSLKLSDLEQVLLNQDWQKAFQSPDPSHEF